MVCLYCGNSTQVTNSRPQKRTNTTWRRRQCTACHKIVTTEEAALLSSVIAVERLNGQIVPFEREKLLVSLYNSLRHRKTALRDAVALTNTVISLLIPQSADVHLHTTIIIKTSAEVLDRFDTAAAVQYRAYHPTSLQA